MDKFNSEIVGYGVRFKSDNKLAGYLTGKIEYGDNRYWYIYILIDKNSINEGSVDINTVYIDKKVFYKPLSATQNIVNQTINNNKIIQENLLICAKLLNDASELGSAVNNDFKKSLFVIQKRLTDRNIEIEKSGLVENIAVGTSPTFGYINELKSFMNNPGIGVVPLVVVGYVIIAALISYTAVSIAWKVFQSKYLPESVKDVKISDDLLVNMKNELKPETWDQFKNQYDKLLLYVAELEKKVKRNSITGIIKMLGFTFVGVYAADKFIFNKK